MPDFSNGESLAEFTARLVTVPSDHYGNECSVYGDEDGTICVTTECADCDRVISILKMSAEDARELAVHLLDFSKAGGSH